MGCAIDRIEGGHLTIRDMPCLELKELEEIYIRYEERRRVAIPPSSERRSTLIGRYRSSQARIAYLIRLHRQNCAACSQAE